MKQLIAYYYSNFELIQSLYIWLSAVIAGAIAIIILLKSIPLLLDLRYLPQTKDGSVMGVRFRTKTTDENQVSGNNDIEESLTEEESNEYQVAKGKVGEMMSSIIFINDGWRQLPSQYDGTTGVDGLFVKKAWGGLGYRVAFVETKSYRRGKTECDFGLASYNNGTKSSYKYIISQLDNSILVPETKDEKNSCTVTRDEMRFAIKLSSFYIKNVLVTHDLFSGITRLYRLDKNGSVKKIAGKETPFQVKQNAAHKYLFESISISVARLTKQLDKTRLFDDSQAMKSYETNLGRTRDFESLS